MTSSKLPRRMSASTSWACIGYIRIWPRSATPTSSGNKLASLSRRHQVDRHLRPQIRQPAHGVTSLQEESPLHSQPLTAGQLLEVVHRQKMNVRRIVPVIRK